MDKRSERHDYLVIYSSIHRRAIGILGFVFPCVLAVGAMIVFRTELQSSISAYYHTGMGDYFGRHAVGNSLRSAGIQRA